MLSTNQSAGFLNQSKSMKQPHFLHVDTNSQKFKVDPNFFWLGIVKNRCGQSGVYTLKLTLS